MKKNLLLGFSILILLNTAVFAGWTDPKKESEKPAIKDLRENKLSEEEISRLSRRVETNNLYNSNLSNKEKNDSKNDLKPAQEKNHTRFYVGAGVIIMIIVLILVLV